MIETLRLFMNQVSEFRLAEKEVTIFSLGGRGYYENAASDMLAFFLQPDAEHGFGDLFLTALFECGKVSDNQFPALKGVRIDREVKTKNGNRIDLQILADSWCWMIENKIRHAQNNPFDDYEDHARAFEKSRTFFAVLSPAGESHRAGWKGIKYADYCAVLRQRLGAALFSSPHSKWHLFAREFILHIENELYTPAMNQDQVEFVEKYAEGFIEAQKLLSEYRRCVGDRFRAQMQIGSPDFSFDIREEFGPRCFCAWRCTSPQWKKNDMLIFKGAGEGQKFFAYMFLSDMSEPRLTKAREVLAPMKMHSYTEENKYPAWKSLHGHDSASGAIDELCKVAQIAKDVLTL